MSACCTTLEQLGSAAVAHRGELEEVKWHFSINHNYLDCWIYGFLENKQFNVEESVAKLHRRFAMEADRLATIELTAYMRACLRCGSHQFIGVDKIGRSVFLINIKRDLPDPAHAEERHHLFDLFMSYGSRLRPDGTRCQMVVLFNQEGADSKKNFDLSALLTSARHVAKFYPGALDKSYFCKMGRVLTTMAKPVLKAFPASVTSRLAVLSDHDLREGALLQVMDAAVLPISLGGANDCDRPERWCASAEAIESYFTAMQEAIRTRGVRVKEYELECMGVRSASAVSTTASWALPTVMEAKGEPCIDHDLSGTLHHGLSETLVHDGRTMSSVAEAEEQSHPAAVTLRGIADDTVLSALPSPQHPLPPSSPSSVGTASAAESGDLEMSPSWCSVVSPLSSTMALWFLEELLHWRETIEEAEREERQKMMDTIASERAAAAACAMVKTATEAHDASLGGAVLRAAPMLLFVLLSLNLVVLTLGGRKTA